MGGDGGTLNNTRAEHARICHSAYGNRRPRPGNLRRSSVSECYLSNEPLIPREVVVDKLGQLYNKSALIEALLSRHTGHIAHVKKLARDIVSVKYEVDEADTTGMAICAVTKSVVRCDGTFSVGWFCGCITANISVSGERMDPENATQCAACGTEGYRIVLGQTAERRKRLQNAILENRKAMKNKKKRRAIEGATGAEETKKAKIAIKDGTRDKDVQEDIEPKEEANASGEKVDGIGAGQKNESKESKNVGSEANGANELNLRGRAERV